MSKKSMDNDVNEIIKQVESKIKELETKQKKKEERDNIIDLDEIIKEIDKKINEMEIEEKKIDVESLNKKINQKLNFLSDYSEDELDRTIYDLSEISKTVNETIKQLEAKKKEKKRKKAMYCDMARKRLKKN